MANGSQECMVICKKLCIRDHLQVILVLQSMCGAKRNQSKTINAPLEFVLRTSKVQYSGQDFIKSIWRLSLSREHYAAAAAAPCCSSMWMTWLLVEIINYVATPYALLQNERSWAFSLFPRAYNLPYEWWHSTSSKEICRGSSCLLIS